MFLKPEEATNWTINILIHKEITMWSPHSGNLADLYLQKLEQDVNKQWLDRKEIYFYNLYVDEIIII